MVAQDFDQALALNFFKTGMGFLAPNFVRNSEQPYVLWAETYSCLTLPPARQSSARTPLTLCGRWSVWS